MTSPTGYANAWSSWRNQPHCRQGEGPAHDGRWPGTIRRQRKYPRAIGFTQKRAHAQGQKHALPTNLASGATRGPARLWPPPQPSSLGPATAVTKPRTWQP
eukprot:388420-Prymnesium_polylepis.1